jgi:hypothetical protein
VLSAEEGCVARVPFLLILAMGWILAAILVPPGRPAFIGLAVVCAILWWAGRSLARERSEKARLLREGMRATARIRSVRQSPVQGKTRGYLNIELELDISGGGETWRVQRRERVPELHVRRVAVDAVLPVRVDSNDRSRLLIDWDAAPEVA